MNTTIVLYFLRSINKVKGMVDLSEGPPNMEFGETVCFRNGYVIWHFVEF